MPAGNLTKVAINDIKKTLTGQLNVNNLSTAGYARTKVIREVDRVLGRAGIQSKDFVSSVFSVGFNSALSNNGQGFFSGFLKGIKIAVFGMPDDVNNRTSPENLISIRSVDAVNQELELVVVKAFIQNQVELKVESKWGPFMDLGGIKEDVQSLFQLITRRALVTQWSSRRIWKGSSPMVMSIPIRFEAINDAEKEVVMACKKLQQLAAPRKGFSFSKGSVLDAFLVPPGPSPFSAEQILSKIGGENIEGHVSTGELTTIEIGSFLIFEKVVVREVTVVFDNRMSVTGHPIGATATIVFETYEMLTKNDLDNAYVPKTAVQATSAVKI